MTVEASAIFRPGVLRGDYPERLAFNDKVLDRGVAWLTSRVAYRRHFSPAALDAVVAAIDKRAFAALDDQALSERIPIIKAALHRQGFRGEAALDAFALIREVASRQLGMRHFDVQLIGGWVMLQGMVAEMDTGEGKTLTATLPACTAAMAGIPVHVVTVNDYLVQRDAELMGTVYRALGLTCGIILEGMDHEQRRAAYACDITYCSNKQLTFDYLKDRMVLGRKSGRVNLQLDRLVNGSRAMTERLLLRGLCFAIVDEADSVLIDESRTPLILSRDNPSMEQLLVYQQALAMAEALSQPQDFILHPRLRSIELTSAGKSKIEKLSKPLGGVWTASRRARELISQALSAHHLFIKDIHYLVQDGKVVIIDEYTGRVMPDRSWERGLHQMIETKENCAMTDHRETIARISYQTFFRRYLHLAGMTGTAKEVRRELYAVYGLSAVRIPTNRPSQRRELPSHYYLSLNEKWRAVVERIKAVNRSGRPVLIGTRSVEASEHLGYLLALEGLPHRILNARQNAEEAEIVKLAGQPRCITVATNMAGRGTDIKLTSEVNTLGGLHVILTECHDAGRIDRQLFGRCGRQGDQGSYERILSFEDELIRLHLSKHLHSLLNKCLGSRRLRIDWLGRVAFGFAQQGAERYHAAMRRALFKKDNDLQQLLAFSGKSE